MLRLFLAIFTILSLLACKTRGQNTNDVISSLKLFKEGGDLMIQGVEFGLSDSLSSRKYYEEAIEKFLTSYRLDTSNTKLGTYLSFLYYQVQKFDSALAWGIKLLPIDSINSAGEAPMAFAGSLTHIGLCYLNIGDLSAGSEYLRRGLLLDNRSSSIITHQLMDLSDQIYNKKYQQHSEVLLKRKVNPCEYSIDIMTLALKISDSATYIRSLLKERKKNCSNLLNGGSG